MNLYFGYLLCCYLFCLFLFSPIFIHLYTLCHFDIGEVDSWSQIRFPPSGGVLICQFCLILLKYHHKLYLHILKRDDSSLLHCVIRWRPEKIFSRWLLITTLCSDDQNKVVGPCRKQLNGYKCVFWNLIDAFCRCLDGGYTCLWIFSSCWE